MPVRVSMRSLDELDPIAAALAPPSHESPQEHQERTLRERAAKQVSDEIDAQLAKEKQHAKRLPKPVKILLLGQSESGKSTTLKNFQLMCEPQAFRAERASWRAIIHLNILRSFRIILDALVLALNAVDLPPDSDSDSSPSYPRPDTELLALRTRLLPLLDVEDALTRRLATLDVDHLHTTPEPARGPLISNIFRRRAGKEIEVNSAVAWKSAFMRDPGGRESFDTQNAVDWDDTEDPGPLLHARSEDMQRLWTHPTVRAILDRQGIRLQETSGFFLDELEVVTSLRYVPTDGHILRARLKTLGVSEHRMRLTDPTRGITREFWFYDVGGHRSMVPKWVPYFDDMDAVIVLAPISGFDQVLEEDPNIYRLPDSLELWTSVVSNKLLQKTDFILFLNKVDILQAKITSGIQFADYVPSYGRRPNDMDSITRYMRKQFMNIMKQASPSPRIFYCHLTNVIDIKATTYVLDGIRDVLMRFHLKESRLIA
ncbi:guanine nucleotide binding protein, alpha subunit [Mycena alexandri]|uniref:Guanine nucleotide binding protein, alpha subunit n=1 Tax=Mycena alexandri TaxID=1745969 RepID=A0AAD6SKS9_9AGAR|nr:guanine nucleotide binding protein, alpha subunit [Mycena alexandri]KAJ7032896.1 guanine nucleotide binding protein, alpha subunit [Mycena alexandri]